MSKASTTTTDTDLNWREGYKSAVADLRAAGVRITTAEETFEAAGIVPADPPVACPPWCEVMHTKRDVQMNDITHTRAVYQEGHPSERLPQAVRAASERMWCESRAGAPGAPRAGDNPGRRRGSRRAARRS